MFGLGQSFVRLESVGIYQIKMVSSNKNNESNYYINLIIVSMNIFYHPPQNTEEKAVKALIEKPSIKYFH